MATILDQAAEQAEKYGTGAAMLADSMPQLVKGYGYAKPKGIAPLDDDDERVFKMAMQAEMALHKAIRQGYANPDGVRKSLNPAFSQQFAAFLMENPAMRAMSEAFAGIQQAFSELGKNITLTSPLSSGYVPFDLVSPASLIYPVYTPLRNKIPRVPGQGTSRRRKLVTAISGSGQSSAPVIDTTISELNGGSLSGNWPLNLPNPGVQTGTEINVPYRFWGITESVSWLAQFAGQGYEDVAALASLIMLQEMMLSEEYADIAATSISLGTPAAPVLTARAAQSGETGLSGLTTNLYAVVTYTNYYGETVASTAANVAASNGQVVDVALPGLSAGMQANIYVSTGASDPGTHHLMVSGVGGAKYTLQGAVPTTGNVPPVTDTTTSAATRQEGLLSVLSGHASNGSIYPSGAGWQAGYYNKAVGDTLNRNVLNTALSALQSQGSYKASPSEIICEASDGMRLSNDILNSGSNSNFRLYVEQAEQGGVRDGAAVSEFVNPITRDILKILVHPWFLQGVCLLMSYTLPFSWSNVANVFEMTVVQDYLSINWPTIDASFRYSLFLFGSLVCNAPQYCGLLTGLQASTPSNGGTYS